MKKILGGMLVGVPFVALFSFQVITMGWLSTFATWGAALVTVAILLCGMVLLTDDMR